MAYKSEKQKVTIFLEPDEKDKLRAVAKAEGRSMASQARQAVLQSMASVPASRVPRDSRSVVDD